MEQLLHNNEALFRLGAFAVVLVMMLLWEALNPRHSKCRARLLFLDVV